MEPVVAALRAQQDELTAIVAGLGASDLQRPSRCDGWTVADVLLHLAQTDEMAVASVEGRLDEWIAQVVAGMPPAAPGAAGSIDDLAGALVDLERGAPVAARDRYLRSSMAQADAFSGCRADDRVSWVAGDMAARTLATTRLTECWIHTVDVAVALGPEPAPTDRLWHTVRLVWRTVPYAFTLAGRQLVGPVAFDLEAPDGTTWRFGTDDSPVTVVRGTAHELCTVAGQRASAGATGLVATGPDASEVLELMRTFA
jgi:uncharacterized protein (TIGR03084 family)